MATTCTSSTQPNKLVEFHKICLFGKSGINAIEALYGRHQLMPSYEYFHKKAMEQLKEVLKPRPKVQPLIKQKRRFRSNVPTSEAPSDLIPPEEHKLLITEAFTIPTVEAPYHLPETSVTLSAEVPKPHSPLKRCSNNKHNPTSHKKDKKPVVNKPTARKSTSRDDQSISRIPTIKPSKVCLIDLKSYLPQMDLLLKQYEKYSARREQIETSVKIVDRKESTDSGVASGDDESLNTATPIIIKLTRSGTDDKTHSFSSVKVKSTYTVSLNIDSTPHQAPAKLRKISNPLYGSTHKKRCTKEAFRSSKHLKSGSTTQRKPILKKEASKMSPSLPVSIPWNDSMTMVPAKRKRFIENFHNPTEETILPKDVIESVELDLYTLQMTPLARKRYKDPAPPMFFPPYQGEKYVCIICNVSFRTNQECAKHRLTHQSFSF